MDIIVWIIFGALAGWIASTVAGSEAGQSTLTTIIVGVIGAVAGGYAVSMYAPSGVGSLDLTAMVVAVSGSVMALWIYKTVNARA